MSEVRNIINLTPTSWIEEGILPDDIRYTQEEFQELWNSHPPTLGQFKIYGKLIDTPRYQQTYLRDYHFSRMDHQSSLQLPPLVWRLLNWVNQQPQWKGSNNEFNQVLINWYQDGSHYIGPHSDNENELVSESPIFSLSLGASRKFRIRKKIPNKTVGPIDRDFILNDNHYVVMGGTLQKTHKHEIVKITGEKAKLVGPRINITFRKFK